MAPVPSFAKPGGGGGGGGAPPGGGAIGGGGAAGGGGGAAGGGGGEEMEDICGIVHMLGDNSNGIFFSFSTFCNELIWFRSSFSLSDIDCGSDSFCFNVRYSFCCSSFSAWNPMETFIP